MRKAMGVGCLLAIGAAGVAAAETAAETAPVAGLAPLFGLSRVREPAVQEGPFHRRAGLKSPSGRKTPSPAGFARK